MEYPIPATITDALVYDKEATIVIATAPEYYQDPKLQKRTAGELGRVWRDSETYQRRMVTAEGAIGHAEQYIKENFEDIGEEHATELAGLLGFDLTTTVEVTFQVEITATVTLPIGKDFSDLSEYDFDVELSTNEMDYEIETYDATIERMRES